jgi:hypothetical protein
MKRFLLALIALVALSASTRAQLDSTISKIAPASVVAGSGSFTLILNGVFGAGGCHTNNVSFNGVTLTTIFETSSIIYATVPGNLIQAIGSASIHTVCFSHISNTVFLPVLNPLAVITSYTPTYFVTGQNATVTVHGQDFSPASTILFDFQAITTTFVDTGTLTGTIPGAIVTANAHHLYVYNGPFRGGSVTQVRPVTFNPGTISVSTPNLNSLAGSVIRDTSGTVTLGTPWFTLGGSDPGSFTVGTVDPPATSCGDGLVLGPNLTCGFVVSCVPGSAGAKSATLTVLSDATNGPQVSNLSCTGSTAKTIATSATSLSFGSVATTKTATNSTTLSATFGSFALGTPYYTLTGDASFTVTGGSCANGFTLGSCGVIVSFTPTTIGVKTATLAINSAADNSVSIALSGTGVTATTHQVLVSWTASMAANVVGYNVYRAVAGGTFSGTPLNGGTPVATTSYTDTTAVTGTSYVYGVTTVGGPPAWATGTESTIAASNQVTP